MVPDHMGPYRTKRYHTGLLCTCNSPYSWLATGYYKFTGIHRTIWDHTGPYGTTQDLTGPYRNLLDLTLPYGTIMDRANFFKSMVLFQTWLTHLLTGTIFRGACATKKKFLDINSLLALSCFLFCCFKCKNIAYIVVCFRWWHFCPPPTTKSSWIKTPNLIRFINHQDSWLIRFINHQDKKLT